MKIQEIYKNETSTQRLKGSKISQLINFIIKTGKYTVPLYYFVWVTVLSIIIYNQSEKQQLNIYIYHSSFKIFINLGWFKFVGYYLIFRFWIKFNRLKFWLIFLFLIFYHLQISNVLFKLRILNMLLFKSYIYWLLITKMLSSLSLN